MGSDSVIVYIFCRCTDASESAHFLMTTWDPMAEDYSNKVFNSCQEPEISELLKSMPRY